MRSQQYAQFIVRFARQSIMSEVELKKLVTSLSFTIANLQYRLTDGGKQFEFRMMLRTQDPDRLRQLSEALLDMPTVAEFRIYPTGD
jgi:putative Mg2+ transporter-C (MgtC) family protein